MKTIRPFNFSQEIHGVQVKPLSESGREVRIRYNGILGGSGTMEITLHYGFGDALEWRGVGDEMMERNPEGWESSVSMEDSQLNFCFRDSAFNWDNNNGLNWIYRIS